MVEATMTNTSEALMFWADLTPGEREVGAAIAEGWTNSKIADRLALSYETVERRVSAIYEKLPEIAGGHRRVQVVLLAKSALGANGSREPSRAGSSPTSQLQDRPFIGRLNPYR